MPISPVLQTDTGTVARGKINDAIVEANKVDGIETDITGKANVGGDNLTSAATWRTSLDLYSKPETNALANAKAPAQAIRLTGNSGLTGGVGINFGVSDFSITALVQLPDYTPSANILLFASHSTGNSRLVVTLLTTGVFRLAWTNSGGATTNTDITPTTALTDALWYWITITFTRSGNAVLYVNGITNGSVSISAHSAVEIGASNSNGYQILVNTANNNAVKGELIIWNYALPATTTSGVKGIAERFRDGDWVTDADRWGYSSAIAFSNWSSNPWEIFSAQTGGFDGENTSGVGLASTLLTLPIQTGETIRVRGTVTYISGTGLRVRLGTTSAESAASSNILLSSGAFDVTLTATSAADRVQMFVSSGILASVQVRDLIIEKSGAILHLAPELMQPAPGQCLDAIPFSPKHALQSATGTSLVRPKREGRIYGYASSDGTFWITGTDRVTLPIGARITAVTVKVIGTGGDVSLWDGTTRRICDVQAVTGNRTNALTIDNDAAFCSSGKLRINHEDNIEAYWRVDYVDTEAEFN